MLNKWLKVAFLLFSVYVVQHVLWRRPTTPLHSDKIIHIKTDSEWLSDAGEAMRIESSSMHLPLEVRRDESQIGPAAPTLPELPTSQELIPFNASLPSRRFPERKSPNGKHSQHVFPFVQLDV